MKQTLIFVFMFVLCSCAADLDIEKAFAKHEIVSDVVNVAPKKLLQVTYPSGATVNLGNEITPTQGKDKPKVTWQAEKGAYYTLLMSGPDLPSRETPTFAEVRHWLVMNIPESAVDKGDEVIEYIGGAPPEDSGLHRLIFLVYKQPNGKIDHDEPRATNRELANRPLTSTMNFATNYKFDAPEFGNFYLTQYDEYSDILEEQLMP